MKENQDLMTTMREVLYPGAKQESVNMVLAYCKAAKIDPLLKSLHITQINKKEVDSNGRENWVKKDVVMPGIGLYRTLAERSGAYIGMSEPEFGPDITMNFEGKPFTFPEWCKITVKRYVNGVVAEFTAKEFWLENYSSVSSRLTTPNAIWIKRPRGMISKCTEGQCLRKAFPSLISNQPTYEEMVGKDDYIEEYPNKGLLENSSKPTRSIEDSILSKIKPKEQPLISQEPDILSRLGFFYCNNDEVKDGIDKYLSKLNLERLDQLTIPQGESLVDRVEVKYPELMPLWEGYVNQSGGEL